MKRFLAREVGRSGRPFQQKARFFYVLVETWPQWFVFFAKHQDETVAVKTKSGNKSVCDIG
jgi:hypothetical protein